VDLWDITRLILRRWYFAVLPLSLTVIGVMYLNATVSPDYKATGHLQLVPPAHRDPEAIRTGRAGNPWLDLGIQPMGKAAMIKVQDVRVVRQLTAEGYSSEIVITIDYPTTYLSIEVTGSTPAQATGTVKRVMELLIEDIRAEQEQFKVAQDDSITTVQLDQGDNVVAVNGKVKRTVIGAAGAGLLLTAGFTIGLDALVRRRLRRGAGSPGDPAGASVGPAGDPEPHGNAARTVMAIPPAPWSQGAGSTRESEAEAAAGFSWAPLPDVAMVETAVVVDNDDADSGETRTMSSDATIVLPVIDFNAGTRAAGNEQH
jgi:hypothetical protein